MQLIKLILNSPIIYSQTTQTLDEFEFIKENVEILVCFVLNPKESVSIEPVKEQFLDNLQFFGQKNIENAENIDEPTVSLPAGEYLFMQNRLNRALNRDEWLDMAIEQQKDGLWERYRLKNLLYVRFLHEDGKFVTQVLRPLALS